MFIVVHKFVIQIANLSFSKGNMLKFNFVTKKEPEWNRDSEKVELNRYKRSATLNKLKTINSYWNHCTSTTKNLKISIT